MELYHSNPLFLEDDFKEKGLFVNLRRKYDG